MDILDISGEVQEAISTGIRKTRLDEGGKDISSHEVYFVTTEEGKTVPKSESERERKIREIYEAKGSDYCGSCWGSAPEGIERCCNTCEDVRRSYSEVGWAFHDGSGIQQCEEEGYTAWIEETKNEGCNIAGSVKVNKVAGNFHFAPGSSFTFNGRHSHDMSLYGKKEKPYSFAHTINSLSFGPSLDEQYGDKLLKSSRNGRKLQQKQKDLLVNPLNGVTKVTENKQYTFQYFVKVVATRYETLSGGVGGSGQVLETNQYSVTSHEQDIMGGRDEDHPHTLHGRGGVPGVYFSYEISPMKIINREQRAKTFGSFLTGVCAIVGGVLTVGAIVDRGVWEADKALRRKKER